MASAPEK